MLLEWVPQGMTILTKDFFSFPWWGARLTSFPCPKRFSGVQRIDFYATAFLSLGMLIELFSFYLLSFFCQT